MNSPQDERDQELAAWRTLVPGCETPDELADYIKRLKDFAAFYCDGDVEPA